MSMQVVALDLEDWEAVSRFKVPEAALIGLINSRLSLEAPWLRATVSCLRMTPGEKKNWAVAKFDLEPADFMDMEDRFNAIELINVKASEGLVVNWPTTQLH